MINHYLVGPQDKTFGGTNEIGISLLHKGSQFSPQSKRFVYKNILEKWFI